MKPPYIVRRSVASYRMFLSWLPVVLTFSIVAALHGQEPSTIPDELPPGQILIRRDDGRTVPLEDLIPADKVDRILESVTAQLSVRRFEFADLDASGIIQDGLAKIHVDLKIKVHADDEWVRVNVGLGSWVPTSAVHGPSDLHFESRFLGSASSASDSHQWLLKGRGHHELSLDLIGEIRDQDKDRHRIKLSLPDAMTSELALTFDQSVERIQDNAAHSRRSTSSVQPVTAKFWGLKSETEISWQPPDLGGDNVTAMSAPTPTSMVLDLSSSTPVLVCDQTIDITEGATDRLMVRLAPGYGEIDITARDEGGSLAVRSDNISMTDSGSTADIVFARPVRGRIDLHFELTLKDTTQGISVSVPDFDGITQQSAKVEIRIPRGLEVDIVPTGYTRRTRVETNSDQRNEAIAFDLLSTEARLRLDVKAVEARFAVAPRLEFSTDARTLRLLARFPVNVSLGSLDELRISWNHYIKNGWQIETGSIFLTEDDGERSKIQHEQTDKGILLQLGNVQSGQFHVEFKAFRSLDERPAETGITFSLPDITATDAHPTTVSLVESDTYSLSLTDATSDTAFSIVPPRQFTGQENLQRITMWRVNESGSSVRIRQSRQTQEVSSQAVIALEANQDSIYVRTEITINVRHRDLQELTFTAPDGVDPVLQLSGRDVPEPPGDVDGDEITWQLPEAIRGEHKATIKYFWTPDLESDDHQLPLVLPASGVDSIAIGTNAPKILSVVEDESFHRQFSPEFRTAWSTNEIRRYVRLRIPQPLLHRQIHEPSICLVQTYIGSANVTTTTTVIYENPPETVLFRVPVNVGVKARVDGTEVEVPRISQAQTDSAELRLVSVAPEFSDGPVRISLICRIPRDPHHHLLSREDATYARLHDAPDWLTTVWLVGARGDNNLISLDTQQQSVLRHGMTEILMSSVTNRTSDPVESLFVGFPDGVRMQVRRQLNDSYFRQQASLAFIGGPSFRTLRVMLYSQAVAWVVVAGLGVLFYAVLVILGRHLRMLSVILIPACVVVWATLPQQTLALFPPVLLAVLIASAAWTFREVLMPAGIQRRSRRRGKSIFSSAQRSPSMPNTSSALIPAVSSSEAEPAVL
ncbi:MAG: hypothetical protein MK102_17190 [Fuerstiella sp.]|nr:hypothetical protein [Fuerstiella sp.]